MISDTPEALYDLVIFFIHLYNNNKIKPEGRITMRFGAPWRETFGTTSKALLYCVFKHSFCLLFKIKSTKKAR